MFLALQSVPDISCIVASLYTFISTARQPPDEAAKLLKVAPSVVIPNGCWGQFFCGTTPSTTLFFLLVIG